MSENKNSDGPSKKPLTLSRKLDLKDLVPDRSSHMRGGKTVIVEVKKSRNLSDGGMPSRASPDPSPLRTPSTPLVSDDSGMRASKPIFQATRTSSPGPSSTRSPIATGQRILTHQEKEARLKALHQATKFVEQKAAQLDETSKRSATIRQMTEEEQKQKELLQAEWAAAQEEAALLEQEQIIEPSAEHAKFSRDILYNVDDDSSKALQESKKPPAVKRIEPRRSGKITVVQALTSDEDGLSMGYRRRSLASIKRAREKERLKHMALQPSEKISREIILPETITIQELANRMAERSAEVIKCCMKMGLMVTITQSIDADTAQLIAEDMGHRVKRVSDADVEDVLIQENDPEDTLVARAPVVTIMGHVDHGKTSLLDALRTTDVASTEAGGITQHIGAYQVTLPSKAKITFIDTPGHAAFTEMRARGAMATDIVVLVVAADDGIQDQTIEAIRHAKAAKVPIIVAINKIDKPGGDATRVRQELMQHEIFVEDMGGDVLCVEVSAKKRLNLDKLEDAILLQAEIMNLRANPNPEKTQGIIIEARFEKGRGPVATTLVQRGTLELGQFFIAGTQWGRIRTLTSDHGTPLRVAGPSVPVEVVGFTGLPAAGDVLVVTAEEAKAREISEYRQRKQREKAAVLNDKNRMDHLFSKRGDHKELCVLVKGDVQGSLEAIVNSLQKIDSDEVSIKVLHSGVGGINETDVSLAKASNALIIGFNVRANAQARELMQRDRLEVRYYSIIYDIINDVKALMSGLLSPTIKETFIGRAEIRKVFKITGSGTIAGCYVTEGMVKRGAKVRLLRDNIVIHEGKLKTLKRMKEEVKEVKQGFECGMAFDNYEDIRESDIIECSEVESVARTL